VASILAKRRRIDWKQAAALTVDIRPNRGGDDKQIEYLVLWEDGLESWELVDDLLNVKDLLREFDQKKREEEMQE